MSDVSEKNIVKEDNTVKRETLLIKNPKNEDEINWNKRVETMTEIGYTSADKNSAATIKKVI